MSPYNLVPKKTQEQWENIVNALNKVVEWFKHFKENVATLSIDLMTWTFDVITSVVLHTPSIIFSGEWFSNNLLMFTGLSIVMSMILTMNEGFKRMINPLLNNKKPTTDMARISRRFPFVLLGSALAPMAFYYGFNAINKLTDVLIDIGRSQMNSGLSKITFSEVSVVEVIAFIGFDIALIGMMIPVFLQNFRRWFDLLALGVMTPLALSCWMFAAHEHYFKSWWEHIKKCSIVQIVYAVFLLMIGGLMFGGSPPESASDLMIEIGIVIGGLFRMNNPPTMMKRYLDSGVDAVGIWKGAGNAITPHPLLRKAFRVSNKLIPKKE